jgi:hypothetical protein
MAPPPRVWDTREGLLRLNSAVGAGIFVFVLCATLRVFEASTGVTDAPGSRSSTTIGLQAISTLLSISLGFGVAVAALLGAGSLYRLHRGRAEFGARREVEYRKAAGLLALSVLLPAAATGFGWLYLDGVQGALPGSGTISDFGLARLWDHFRLVVLASALAGLASAFLLVKGLEGPATSLPQPLPLRSYRAFAFEFVAAAALNAAMVLVVFFALLNPPALDAPASPPIDLLLLAPGPLVAVHALVRLRSFVAAALLQAEQLGRERASIIVTPAPPASAPGFS